MPLQYRYTTITTSISQYSRCGAEQNQSSMLTTTAREDERRGIKDSPRTHAEQKLKTKNYKLTLQHTFVPSV